MQAQYASDTTHMNKIKHHMNTYLNTYKGKPKGRKNYITYLPKERESVSEREREMEMERQTG